MSYARKLDTTEFFTDPWDIHIPPPNSIYNFAVLPGLSGGLMSVVKPKQRLQGKL